MISLPLQDDVASSKADHIFAQNTYAVYVAPKMSPVEAVAVGQLPNEASASKPSIDLTEMKKFTRWSPYLERNFQRLVGLRATGKLTRDDRITLDRYRKERQRLKNPLSSDVILWDFKAQQLRRKAMQALSEYAAFLESSPRNKKS